MKVLYSTVLSNQPCNRRDKLPYSNGRTNKGVSPASHDYFSSINRNKVSFTGFKVENEPNGREVKETFGKYYRFTPDEYQERAAAYLYNGHNTIVTAPTGTGKTLIAEYIICKNLDFNFKNKTMGNDPKTNRTFYTTPLKALSEQKYRDFCGLFGKKNVGIMTGDRKINTQAPIVIMTTEIYKNMLNQNKAGLDNESIKGLKTVVFDEFHYMNDNDRGHVWEESIMFTPDNIQILALSATARNAADINDWIQSINSIKGVKETKLVDVPSENRHVPLDHYVYRPENEGKLELMFPDENNDRNNVKHIKEKLKKMFNSKEAKSRQQTYEPEDKLYAEDYITDLINTMDDQNKLPAIVFIMSRTGCQKAINEYKQSGRSLLNEDEIAKVQDKLNEYKKKNIFLGIGFDKEALKKGIAVHNASILPSAKRLIEELFQQGLIKVVFATETLAAGINMPAKTTVITDMTKPDPNRPLLGNILSSSNPRENKIFRLFTPTEFQQIAGRAGRRGIDTRGNVIVICPNEDLIKEAKVLAKSPPVPIKSKFKATYSSLASFFIYRNKMSDLEKFLDRSFMVYDTNDGNMTKSEKLDRIVNKFNAIKEILKDKKYIRQVGSDEMGEKNPELWNNDNSYYVNTAKGNIAAKIRGVNEILLTEIIFGAHLETLSPKELAGFCAALTLDEPKDKSIVLNTDMSDNLLEKIDYLTDTAQEIENLQSKYGMDENEDKINLDINMIPYVSQWAEHHDDEIAAWKNTIEDLKELNAKNTEGDFVRSISNAVNILNQVKEVSEKLGKTKNGKSNENFEKLADNAEKAVKLLQKSPAWDNLSV